MAGINGYGCTGVLTIGSTSMNNIAWDITDLTDLWFTVEQRGDDRLLPGATGAIPYRRRLAPARHDLTILIVGDVNESGTPFADAKVGLRTNLATLYTNVIAPTGATDGTRAATLTVPGASNRTASIHVLGLVKQRQFIGSVSAAMEATLQISIPAGRFV